MDVYNLLFMPTTLFLSEFTAHVKKPTAMRHKMIAHVIYYTNKFIVAVSAFLSLHIISLDLKHEQIAL